jgi:hypothetical protein
MCWDSRLNWEVELFMSRGTRVALRWRALGQEVGCVWHGVYKAFHDVVGRVPGMPEFAGQARLVPVERSTDG